MAYQCGTIRFTGTIGDITYYRMNGEYHARTKSSLTGKKFWKHRAFEGSRRSCKRFADGNKLASQVYQSLPKEQRHYALFCQLKRAAIHYIKLGLTAEEAKPYLQQHAAQEQFILPAKAPKPRVKKAFPYAITITSEYIALTGGRLQQLLKTCTNNDLAYRAEQTLKGLIISPSAAISQRQRA